MKYFLFIVCFISISRTNGGPAFFNPYQQYNNQFQLNTNPFGTPIDVNSMLSYIQPPQQNQQVFPLAGFLNTVGGLAQGLGFLATSALGTFAGLLNGILGIFIPPAPAFQMPLPFQSSFNPFLPQRGLPNNVGNPNIGPRLPTAPIPPLASGGAIPTVPRNAATPGGTAAATPVATTDSD